MVCGAVLTECLWPVYVPRAPGWHKDGWHFQHFLDTPQQGLLLMYFYSDVPAGAGGTQVTPLPAQSFVGPIKPPDGFGSLLETSF